MKCSSSASMVLPSVAAEVSVAATTATNWKYATSMADDTATPSTRGNTTSSSCAASRHKASLMPLRRRINATSAAMATLLRTMMISAVTSGPSSRMPPHTTALSTTSLSGPSSASACVTTTAPNSKATTQTYGKACTPVKWIWRASPARTSSRRSSPRRVKACTSMAE